MKRKYPTEKTKTDVAFRLMHKSGPLSAADIESVTGLTHGGFNSLASCYGLIRTDNLYSLPEYLIKYYDDLEIEKIPGIPVPSRTYVKNSPLKNYAESLKRAASMREGCGLREIYYRAGGMAGNPSMFDK